MSVGRYVVGIDGSRSAQIARIWAELRALHAGAECRRVYIDRGTGDTGYEDPYLPNRVFDDAVIVVPGVFPDALLHQVRPGDTLVIGTGKTGFLHGRVCGSAGIETAALAPCSVVVVPDVDVHFRSGVVAGIHRSETAALVAVAAAEEAAFLGTSLQLLHSEPAPAAGARGNVDPAIAVAETAVRTRWPDLQVRTRVVERPAAEALLDAARNAALLVLGPGPGAKRETAAYPGRVLHDVLINLNAPTKIVRERAPAPD